MASWDDRMHWTEQRAALRDRVTRAVLEAKGLLPPERKRYRAWAAEKRAWRARRHTHCPYCGHIIRDKRGKPERGLACYAHSDLPGVDESVDRGDEATGDDVA